MAFRGNSVHNLQRRPTLFKVLLVLSLQFFPNFIIETTGKRKILTRVSTSCLYVSNPSKGQLFKYRLVFED